jgi:hypothetical protein
VEAAPHTLLEGGVPAGRPPPPPPSQPTHVAREAKTLGSLAVGEGGLLLHSCLLSPSSSPQPVSAPWTASRTRSRESLLRPMRKRDASDRMIKGEVRHLWRAGTAHHSSEPREEDVAPRLGGSRAPWAPLSTVARRGGPRPPKSLPSPPGKVEVVRLGAPPVQECTDQLVVKAKA